MPLNYTCVEFCLFNHIESVIRTVMKSYVVDMTIVLLLFQVEKLGRESFFFLSESFPFDESSFGKLSDTVTLKKPLPVSKPVSYVFRLNLPYELTTLLWYRGM